MNTDIFAPISSPIPSSTISKTKNFVTFGNMTVSDDKKSVLAEKITTTCKATYGVYVNEKNEKEVLLDKNDISSKKEDISFSLTEVSAEEIPIKTRNTPSLLIKKDGQYYLAKIPRMLSLTSSRLALSNEQKMQKHLCSQNCKNLMQCPRVRKLSINLERIPWITSGYSTFNTSPNKSCVVLECEHYQCF